MIQFAMVTALVALLLLLEHHQVSSAGGGMNDGGIHVLAVESSHRQIMQVVRSHRPQRFSYCLFDGEVPSTSGVPRERYSFVRFDGEVPSTSGMPHAQLLYNAAADYYGPYFVELVGVSVAGRRLEGVSADTFRRDESSGKGGTRLNVASDGVVMARAAYEVLERAVEEHLRPFGLPRVSHPPFTFCLRGATAALAWHLPTVSLHFREPGAEIEIPLAQLFTLRRLDACLAVVPGDITVIGSMAQLGMRFTFDLSSRTVFFKRERCERDTGRSSSTTT